MNWDYSFTEAAFREFKKLDPSTQKSILKFFDGRITSAEDPRRSGKALQAGMTGYWRYRVGDYRVICQIKDEEVLVLILKVGHRREVYD